MKAATSRHEAWSMGVWSLLGIFAANAFFMPGCAFQRALSISRGQPVEHKPLHRLSPGARLALKQGQLEQRTIPVEIKSDISTSFCGGSHTPGPNSGDSLAGASPVITMAALIVVVGKCLAEFAAPPALQETAAEAFASALGEQRPLSERVQDYARAHGLGSLAVLPHEATQLPDYVIEYAVTNLEFHPRNENTFWVLFIARGRVVRLKDNAVVDEISVLADTNYITVASWTAKTAHVLSREFDIALNKLTMRFVEEQLEPILKGVR